MKSELKRERAEYMKIYRRTHKEQIRPKSQARYLKNREARIQGVKNWLKRHPDYQKTRMKKRYRKERAMNLIRQKTKHTFSHLKENTSCEVCGARDYLEFHHIPPYRYDKFIILCPRCHRLIEGRLVVVSEEEKELLNIANNLINEIMKKKFEPLQERALITSEELLKLLSVSKHEHYKLAYILAWNLKLKISDVLNLTPDKLDLSKIKVPTLFNIELLKLMPLKNRFKVRALQKAFKLDCKSSGILSEKSNAKFTSLAEVSNG